MNQELLFNPLYQQALYQQLCMNYVYQQQQILQQLMVAQSQTTIPNIVQPIGGAQQLDHQSTYANLCALNIGEKYQTEPDQISYNHSHSDQEESQSRTNGHWSKQEHQLYLNFVKEHEDILRSKYDKKSKKVFKLMSQFIPTRTATQCRSHHQKFNPFAKGKKKLRNNNRSIPTVIIQSQQ